MTDFNLKSTTVEKGLELIKGFLDKAIGPTVEEIGQGLSDNLRLRRFKNQVKNLEKAKKITEDHGLKIKQINLKALFPYLEGVALEEDETLQEMWANMFVNYIDSNKNLTLTVFPDILKHLSSNEVKMVKFMSENMGYMQSGPWGTSRINFPGTYTLEEMGNLARLGIIREVGNFGFYDGNKIEELHPEKYYLTELGYAFLKACER